MHRFRNLILASVAALALLAPGIVPSGVPSPSGQCQAGQTRVYYVYYRSCPQDSWHLYGGYYRVTDAVYATRYFQYYGYDSFYR